MVSDRKRSIFITGRNKVEPENIPLDVVTINSKVRLRKIDSDPGIIIILVFHSDANLSEHKISILAPIGSAVIRRQTGDSIEWKAPGGIKRAKIEKMLYQPETAEKSKL